MNKSEIKKLLNKYNITPSKAKGQNFLLDESVISDMVAFGEVDNSDLVVEIGPGFGVLTKALLEKAKKVLAIELDKQVAEFVEKEIVEADLIKGDVLNNSTFHEMVGWLKKNFKGSTIKKLFSDGKILPSIYDQLDGSYKLIANLPYQITSRVIRQFFETHPRPSLAVLMVQKEVAQRMTAKPGQMSLLSLAVQTTSEAKIIRIVPSSSFYPAPKVDSAVIHADFSKGNKEYAKLNAKQRKLFWQLAKAGFSSKRKQLKNTLKAVLKNDIATKLESAGIKQTARPQELSVDEWIKLVYLL